MSGWQKFFAFAALFNWVAGLAILFAPDLFYQLLFIEERIVPGARLFSDLTAALVITFGWAYWTVSRNPPAHRDLVMMGIIGKTLFVVVTWFHALTGSGPLNFAFLVLADLAFAAIFLRFWLSTRGTLQSG